MLGQILDYLVHNAIAPVVGQFADHPVATLAASALAAGALALTYYVAIRRSTR